MGSTISLEKKDQQGFHKYKKINKNTDKEGGKSHKS